ncbi:heparan-alpha-glucosaminide N-acetyltransferase domain-containing protein [Glutamicibacter sp.]|uniref:heparan-alpha-glucosaminide N-acetyltransferase domain-containing protein n=1 Tax=Glutamicibacter sp. TaxID=1931995 RepID=UPI0028BEAE61|nr:heparan-alpha-glucosaminide N-acetyltransferase domain-containing protein [Glutamicibacter sp.]
MDQPSTSRRLLGVDAARLLAILGMFAAHVFTLSTSTAEGAYSPTITGALAAGRASVLFMVLAGISLVLLTESMVRKGFSNPKVYSILFRRALIIAVLGLLIGSANEAIANILVHYGILFLLLPLAITLSRATLWIVSSLWLIIAPILWRPLEAEWNEQSLGHNPNFLDLTTPGLLFKDLFVTGYYPLLVWLGYGLLGMAVARSNLRSTRAAWHLFIWGSLIAVSSLLLGWLVSSPSIDRITELTGASSTQVGTLLTTGRLPGSSIDPLLGEQLYLWLPTAHSQSLISTIHTAAFAVAVIGLMQLIVRRLGAFGRFVSASGKAPLTLYVGHLLFLPLVYELISPTAAWWILCSATALLGLWLMLNPTSGPLESLVRTLSGADVPKNNEHPES